MRKTFGGHFTNRVIALRGGVLGGKGFNRISGGVSDSDDFEFIFEGRILLAFFKKDVRLFEKALMGGGSF